MTCLASIPAASPPSIMSVLYVAGEVDAAAAPRLRSQLVCACEDPPRDVVVDLSRVTFMSCTGLRPLTEAEARLGERLWLRRVPPPVTRLLELTHLCSTFRVLEYRMTDDDESVEAGTLEAQVEGMQEAMRGRAVIEQAKGLLMDVHDCDAEHAWRLLLRVARDNNVEVGHLAAAVTADAADEGMLGVAEQATLKELLHTAQAVTDGAGR
ncbi:MAG: ANTAR domain-containing protein [Frankiaceae bacterium]